MASHDPVEDKRREAAAAKRKHNSSHTRKVKQPRKAGTKRSRGKGL